MFLSNLVPASLCGTEQALGVLTVGRVGVIKKGKARFVSLVGVKKGT